MSDQKSGSHGSLRRLTAGLIYSIILTVIPFYIVMSDSVSLSAGTILGVVYLMAVVQVIIQAIYFLNMSKDDEGGWNLLTLWFTLMTIIMVVAASIWILYHLHLNTMIW